MAADPVQGRAHGIAAPNGAEAAAAERLYAQHRSRVYSFCLYRLRDRQEAEDAVQTTFLHAFGSLRRGVVPHAESSWLLTIARNVCIARWRSAKRRNGHEFASDPGVLELVPDNADSGGLDLDELQDALGRLPEQQRRAILLREWQGLSYREIADDLGISVSAVEASIFRARRALADELAGRSRRRRGFDLGSLLAGLKSLLGFGAVKIAATAMVLTAAGVVAGQTVARHDAPGRRPAPAVPAAQASVPAVQPGSKRAGASARRGVPTRVPGIRRAQPGIHARAPGVHGSPGGQAPTVSPTTAPSAGGSTPSGSAPVQTPVHAPAVPQVPGVPAAPAPPVSISVPAVTTPAVTVPATPATPAVTVPGVTVPLP